MTLTRRQTKEYEAYLRTLPVGGACEVMGCPHAGFLQKCPCCDQWVCSDCIKGHDNIDYEGRPLQLERGTTCRVHQPQSGCLFFISLVVFGGGGFVMSLWGSL